MALSILLIPCIRNAQEIKIDESWLHQSSNVIGRIDSRLDLRLINDFYPKYTVAGRKDWSDFYGYVDLSKFLGVGSHYDTRTWDEGSPLFTEIEPRFFIDKLTRSNPAFGPLKEWLIANNYVYDTGDNRSSRQSIRYTGLGTDIDTGLSIKLFTSIYAKYQWQNYGAANENEWNGYRLKIKHSIPLTNLSGGRLVYNNFTNFDFGSDLTDKSHSSKRTGNVIASSHILPLLYGHWKLASALCYFHNGGQWNVGRKVNFGDGSFELKNTGWGTYTTIDCQF